MEGLDEPIKGILWGLLLCIPIWVCAFWLIFH
jgi:hypothetical protein